MYFLSNPNIANGWGYSAQANGLELDQVPDIAGRGAVQDQASPCIEGGLDFTKQEEGSHRIDLLDPLVLNDDEELEAVEHLVGATGAVNLAGLPLLPLL